MLFMTYWIFTCKYLLCSTAQDGRKTYTDVGLSVPELITKHGYPVEVFANIMTMDKYLLDVFRIPHGKTNVAAKSSKVVFLMHGLLGTSRDFVVMGPQRGLAYLLADRGYDVWLGNARGTVYSRKHQKLNPDVHQQYWEFSWHEVGIYDLPTMFELVRNVTKKERFSYIGVSQGTTVFYVLASEKPEYNKNITVMVSLAPVAYMGHLYSPIFRFFATYEPLLAPLARILGVNEIPPKPINRLLSLTSRIFCKEESIFIDICASVFFLTGGFDYAQLNKSALYTIYSEGAGGASTRQLLHYAQNINSGRFRQYNFGRANNLKSYGTAQPPDYDLSKIAAPVALFHADQDWLAQPKDVNRLYQELPNCIYKYKVPFPQFNHYDFLYANDVVKLVYQNVFQLMEEYNKDNL